VLNSREFNSLIGRKASVQKIQQVGLHGLECDEDFRWQQVSIVLQQGQQVFEHAVQRLAIRKDLKHLSIVPITIRSVATQTCQQPNRQSKCSKLGLRQRPNTLHLQKKILTAHRVLLSIPARAHRTDTTSHSTNRTWKEREN